MTRAPGKPPSGGVLPEPRIRAGMGGWVFEPWRGVFYPPDLPKTQELAYAGAHLGTIEINSTFYRVPPPATFRKWAGEVPDGFVFSVKASRFATNRRVLAEANESVARFIGAVVALGDRLGPILWQFAPTKKFDPDDFGAFLQLLPREAEGRPLRHAVEVRHPSFAVAAFTELLRKFSIPVVFAEHHTYPAIADLTGDFVYARLQKGDDAIETAYPAAALDGWARRCRAWAEGRDPDDLPHVGAVQPPGRPRDVFVYFIHEGKVRAPAAALALMQRVGG